MKIPNVSRSIPSKCWISMAILVYRNVGYVLKILEPQQKSHEDTCNKLPCLQCFYPIHSKNKSEDSTKAGHRSNLPQQRLLGNTQSVFLLGKKVVGITKLQKQGKTYRIYKWYTLLFGWLHVTTCSEILFYTEFSLAFGWHPVPAKNDRPSKTNEKIVKGDGFCIYIYIYVFTFPRGHCQVPC